MWTLSAVCSLCGAKLLPVHSWAARPYAAFYLRAPLTLRRLVATTHLTAQQMQKQQESGKSERLPQPSMLEKILEDERSRVPSTTVEKVQQASKDVSYTAIIIAGIAVTAGMLFYLGRELMSGDTPTGVYKRAAKLVKQNDEVVQELGEPVKVYGETNRRGRRRYASHFEYEKDGVRFMRMQFYVEGSVRKGTVHLEVKQDETAKYDYRYLFVVFDGFPAKTIVLLDHR